MYLSKPPYVEMYKVESKPKDCETESAFSQKLEPRKFRPINRKELSAWRKFQAIERNHSFKANQIRASQLS